MKTIILRMKVCFQMNYSSINYFSINYPLYNLLFFDFLSFFDVYFQKINYHI